ncbi:MAG TPA: hypothetical protein VIF57_24665 [Polyangia bacterium]|jgi:hypothetical protein
MADLSFIPWLRQGFGTTLPAAPQNAKERTLNVVVETNVQGVVLDIPIVGPGDIAGLDSRVVVRVTPGRDESDAEFEPFVAIELSPVDLPWRYTPTAQSNQQLQPWIALAVLKDDEIVNFAPSTPAQKLPQLTVDAANLPSLTNAWAWAHVQALGTATLQTVTDALAGQPGTLTARIVSPRRLEAKTGYNVFLVPTFARGRVAGTGGNLANFNALDPAWGASGNVTLPVYYQWRFLTGAVGGFEDLVRRIAPVTLDASVGGRFLDVSKPGLNLRSAAPAPTSPPSGPPTAIEVEGALQSVARALKQRAAVGQPFVDDLKGLLQLEKVTFPGMQPAQPVKVVLPPLYGRWPAGETTLDETVNATWFSQLNKDPRERVAGGLGTTVIQDGQEALLAGAWEQVGTLRKVNNERRVLQLGREALLRSFQRQVTTGRIETFFQLTGPLHAFVRSSTGTTTVFSQIAASKAGRDLLDPQWRRLLRVRGPIGRRLGFHINPPTGQGALEHMNTATFRPAPEPPTPKGLVTFGDAFKDLVPGDLLPAQITSLVSRGVDVQTFWGILLFCVARKQLLGTPTWTWWWLLRIVRFGIELLRIANGRTSTDFRIALRDGTLTAAQVQALPANNAFHVTWDDVPGTLPAIPVPGGADSIDMQRLKTAWNQLLTDLGQTRLPLPNLPTLDLASLKAFLTTKIDPRTTVTTKTTTTVTQMSTDPLEPILIAPDYPQPMWAPLRDVSEEWILPGLSGISSDVIGLLAPNQRFIEAYMVGLSHEMARELLWNEFPIDQRATLFRQFWETRGYVAKAGDPTNAEQLKEIFRDIKVITTWPRTNSLGLNSARRRPPSDTLVVLIRGELIHRFPNVVVYAINSFPTTANTIEQHPVFSGRIGQDTAYYGFELSVTDVRGTNPAWYFVMQEQPAEPRFHVPPNVTPGAKFLEPGQISGVTNAAQFAAATFRDPVRVVVPAARLVPPAS